MTLSMKGRCSCVTLMMCAKYHSGCELNWYVRIEVHVARYLVQTVRLPRSLEVVFKSLGHWAYKSL